MVGGIDVRGPSFWQRHKTQIITCVVLAVFFGFIGTGVLVQELRRDSDCDGAGTTYTTRSYEYTPGEGTGPLEACVDPEGRITRVFNDEVTSVDDRGLVKDTEENRRVHAGCTEAGGRVYETTHTDRAPRGHPKWRSRSEKRWVCVVDQRHHPVDLS